MFKNKKPKFKGIIVVLLSFALPITFFAIFWHSLFLVNFKNQTGVSYGVTFSQKQAEELNLPWKDVYQAALDDLQIRHFRLVAYWDLIEPKEGNFNFTDLDWQMDQAANNEAKVILAVGRRVPRWPECHVPKWLHGEQKYQDEELLEYLPAVINRYKNHPALEMWQVENEAFLKLFGNCPPRNKDLLVSEIALVQKLDPNHPIMTTDSGELGSWLRVAKLSDYLGTSAYRVVYNPWVGYVNYGRLIPPAYYRLKAKIIGKPAERIWVSEMQAEPWSPASLVNSPIKEQMKSMDFIQFEKNIAFSRRLGFSRVYLWGVEWWYWMRQQGDDSYWERSRTLF